MREILICFIIASFGLSAQVPTIGDCLGAIPVCSDLYIENESPTGPGNYTSEITIDNCVSIEQNSVWYIFTVQEDGSFGFLLTPNDPLDDYDWSLFNLTNKTCQDLSSESNLISSCNAAGGGTCNGPTGATGSSAYNFQNFGCGNFPPTPTGGGFSAENTLLNVIQGETYALCIINWTGSTNGYTLDFGLSQVDIFDGLDPQISKITLPTTNSCVVESFPISLSEYVTCSSAQLSGITVEGPGGPFTGSLEGKNCLSGGQFDKEFEVVINPPIVAPGFFTVTFDDQLQDLCGNNLEPINFTFSLEEFTTNGQYIMIDSICEGESIVLSVNSEEATNFLWNNGSPEHQLLVEAPGIYTVELSGLCFHQVDTFEVNINSNPILEKVTLGPSACVSASGTLEINETIGSAPFEYSIDNGPFSETTRFEGLDLGLHQVTVRDIYGCESSEAYEIVQASATTIDGITIYEVNYPTQAIFDPTIIGPYIAVNWIDPENLLSCTDCLNPIVSSPIDAVFQLEVEDIYGCITYKNFYLRVTVDRDFYAPTIFSPNGDQINDYFFLGAGPGLANIIQFSVYSRWGEELFRTEDILPNSPSSGWDGTKLGRSMQTGIYPWKAILEYVDGHILEARGTILLVK